MFIVMITNYRLQVIVRRKMATPYASFNVFLLPIHGGFLWPWNANLESTANIHQVVKRPYRPHCADINPSCLLTQIIEFCDEALCVGVV